jgi:hypothetical protein
VRRAARTGWTAWSPRTRARVTAVQLDVTDTGRCTALDAPDPPLRLVLGGDAIDRIRDRLDSLTAELARWDAPGRDTAFGS